MSVLVIGGCGFLGFEVVCLLATEPGWTICVMSRNPEEPRVDALLVKIQPQVIVNTASPLFFQDNVEKSFLHKVNVVGVRNLLELATEITSIRAFVHTSSTSVHGPSTARLRTENAPLIDSSTSNNDYAITKAAADKMVLESNGPKLRTLCLRPPAIYGERDTQSIPGSLAILRDKKTNIQLGDNNNLYDAIYVGNAAFAHVLAVKALLAGDANRKVDGEAFFITDDAPIPFWDFQRKIWAAAGDQTPLSEVRVIPAWVGMAMAGLVEYLFWFFTLGQKLPPISLRIDTLRYTFMEYSFCIDKAKESLCYQPLVSTDEGIRRGVEWAMERDLKAAE